MSFAYIFRPCCLRHPTCGSNVSVTLNTKVYQHLRGILCLRVVLGPCKESTYLFISLFFLLHSSSICLGRYCSLGSGHMRFGELYYLVSAAVPIYSKIYCCFFRLLLSPVRKEKSMLFK